MTKRSRNDEYVCDDNEKLERVRFYAESTNRAPR